MQVFHLRKPDADHLIFEPLDLLPEKSLLIVAGGTGTRMNSDIPKQFLELCGLPVIFRAIKPFTDYDPSVRIVIVLPEEHFSTWKDLCRRFSFLPEVKLAKAGETRFHSVRNGLALVPDDDVVAIHDAVRPLVSPETVDRAFRDGIAFGNAVPVIPVNESVRWKEGRDNHPVDRRNLRIVQTPQVFDAIQIKRAYLRISEQDAGEFTDDASVLEAMGVPVHLFDGNRENLKITHPDDMIIAAALINK